MALPLPASSNVPSVPSGLHSEIIQNRCSCRITHLSSGMAPDGCWTWNTGWTWLPRVQSSYYRPSSSDLLSSTGDCGALRRQLQPLGTTALRRRLTASMPSSGGTVKGSGSRRRLPRLDVPRQDDGQGRASAHRVDLPVSGGMRTAVQDGACPVDTGQDGGSGRCVVVSLAPVGGPPDHALEDHAGQLGEQTRWASATVRDVYRQRGPARPLQTPPAIRSQSTGTSGGARQRMRSGGGVAESTQCRRVHGS